MNISLSDTILSQLIGKLPIITVDISFKNVSHNIVSIFVTVTWTCDSKTLLYKYVSYYRGICSYRDINSTEDIGKISYCTALVSYCDYRTDNTTHVHH